MEWFGFETGVVISLLGIAVLFLFCGIIGVAIWVTGLVVRRGEKPEEKEEPPAEEGKREE